MSRRALAHAVGFPLAGVLLLYAYHATKGPPAPSWSAIEVPPSPAATPELLARGKALYDGRCALCHGFRGKGDGGMNVRPRPRDLTSGRYKLKSTPNGTLPADSDIYRTITAGMRSTTMPAFHALAPEDRWALVHHLKSLAVVTDDEGQQVRIFAERAQGEPIPVRPTHESSPEAILRGREVYLRLKCDACHGPAGRGDGPSAEGMVDDWKAPLVPGDLTKGEWFKGGPLPSDIYRTVTVGIEGTPMPGHADAPEADRWDLAYYVRSLSAPGEPTTPSPPSAR